ncbi:MAG: lipoate--protein ligase, partial [Aquificaceae bacterium]
VRRSLGYMPEKEKVFEAILQGLKEELNIDFQWGELTEEELRLLEEKKDYFKSDEWIFHVKKAPTDSEMLFGIYRCPGGTLRVSAKVDLQRKVLQQVIVNGDFFVKPQRLIYDLEAYLKHTPISDVEKRIREFFSQREWEGLNLNVEDFVEAILFPLRKIEGIDLGIEKKS